MRQKELKITAALIVLMAFIYYIAEPWEITAVLLPAALHEMGHILAIKIQGLQLKGFRAELKGFCIDYCGSTSPLGHILIAASGPAAGFIYAFYASKYSIIYDNEFMALSAGISLLLSLFNLLPVIPLDGGRITAQLAVLILGQNRGAGLAELISTACCLLLMLSGIFLMLENKGIALLVSSIWLLFYQESAKGIVKRREIL